MSCQAAAPRGRPSQIIEDGNVSWNRARVGERGGGGNIPGLAATRSVRMDQNSCLVEPTVDTNCCKTGRKANSPESTSLCRPKVDCPRFIHTDLGIRRVSGGAGEHKSEFVRPWWEAMRPALPAARPPGTGLPATTGCLLPGVPRHSWWGRVAAAAVMLDQAESEARVV